MRVIEDELSHLSALVKEFSSFARMPEMMPRTGLLEPLVQDVAKLYPQIDTHITTHPGLPEFPFDADQLRRVLTNLFDNAASVAREGASPVVRISLSRQGEDAVLVFSDNGPGIRSEHVDRVFDPYFTTRKEGSGLGLAMVKNIILLHGGTIGVQSSEGEGATFTITLPIAGPVAAHPSIKETK